MVGATSSDGFLVFRKTSTGKSRASMRRSSAEL